MGKKFASSENSDPRVSLQTLVMVIQVVDKQIIELRKELEGDEESPDDQVWLYDLERAADNLEEVYKHIIETEGVINFPPYEKLVKRD